MRHVVIDLDMLEAVSGPCDTAATIQELRLQLNRLRETPEMALLAARLARLLRTIEGKDELLAKASDLLLQKQKLDAAIAAVTQESLAIKQASQERLRAERDYRELTEMHQRSARRAARNARRDCLRAERDYRRLTDIHKNPEGRVARDAYDHAKSCDIPDNLQAIGDRLLDAESFFIPGVYFLLDGSEVVYVGRSVQVGVRLTAHRLGAKVWQKAMVLPVRNADARGIIEQNWIRYLRPKYNRQMPTESDELANRLAELSDTSLAKMLPPDLT